jgi:hypothetical protein
MQQDKREIVLGPGHVDDRQCCPARDEFSAEISRMTSL